MKLYTPDKTQVVDVPPERVEEALKAGFSTPAGRVSVRGPSGQAGTIPAERTLQALKKGWRLETEQEAAEREYGGQNIRAGAEALARGATMGASDWVFTKLGGVDPKDIKGRKLGNPVLSATGDVAGAVGSVFIPGGQASGIAKLARGLSAPARGVMGLGARTAQGAEGLFLKYLTKKGAPKAAVEAGKIVSTGSVAKDALARTASLAVAGGVEGSAFGAAHAINESVLGETPLAAQTVLAGLTEGAKWGSAGGLVFGGGALLAGKVVRKASKIAEEKLAPSLSQRAAAADEAIKEGAFSAIGTTRKQAAGKDRAFGDKVRDYLTRNDIHPSGQPIVRPGATVEENAERLGKHMNDTGARIGAFYEELDDLLMTRQTLSASVVDSGTIQKRLHKLAQKYRKDPQGAAGVKEASRLRQFFADEYPTINSWKEAHWIKTRLGRAWFGQPKTAPGSVKEAARSAERIFDDELMTAAEKLVRQELPDQADEILEGIKRANDIYHTLKKAADTAGGPAQSAVDNALGKILGAFSRGVAWRTLVGQPIGSALAGAGAFTAVRFLSESYIKRMGLDLATKAGKLRALQKLTEQASRRASYTVDRMLKPGTAKATFAGAAVFSQWTGEANQDTALKRYALKVHENSVDLEGFADRLASQTSDLEDAAPMLAAEMTATAVRAQGVLQRHAPTPPVDVWAQPKIDWTVSEEEKDEFTAVANAIHDPLGVYEEITSAAAHPAAIDAVREVYPELHEAMTGHILEAVAAAEKQIDWNLRISLSMLLDTPLDPMLLPASIRRSQALYSAQRPRPGRGPQQVRLSGLEAIDDISAQRRSETQRIGENLYD